jgi:ligand-binding sensor domain-containing protein
MYQTIPAQENAIYELAKDSRGRLFAGGRWGRLFKSTDDGESWYQVNSGVKDTRVSALSFPSESMLLVGMHRGGYSARPLDGIWAFEEQGITEWKDTLILPSEVRITALSLSPSGTLFIGTDKGIVRSSLPAVALSDTPSVGSKWITCLVQNSNGSILAGTFDDAVFISTDNGLSWTNSTRGLTRPKIKCIAIQANGTICAGTDRGVFVSTDDGYSWRAIGPDNLTIESIAFTGNWHIIVGTNGAGIHLSDDQGKTWSASSLLNQLDVWSLTTTETGAVIAGTSQGIFRSDNLGKDWNRVGYVFVK